MSDMQHAIAKLGETGHLKKYAGEDYRDGECNQGCQQITFGVVTSDNRSDLFLF